MERFAFAATFSSLRRLLAVVVAGLAVALAGFLISHRLSNPDHYAYGTCPWLGHVYHGPYYPSCRPPARAVWQIPLAVVLVAGGLGAAAVLAGPRPRRRAPAPELGALPPA
jgi:hypothetical protein